MTNPGNLIDGIVSALRSVPDLVAEHGGDANRIAAFDGFYLAQPTVALAVFEMPIPGTLVVYQGFGPGGVANRWHHRVSLFHRQRPAAEIESATTYLAALWLLVNGVPAGQTQRLVDYEFHGDYDSMLPPTLARRTMLLDQAGGAVDYFEVQLAVPEKGDY